MKFCYKVNVQCPANLCFVSLLPVSLFKVTNLQVQSFFHDCVVAKIYCKVIRTDNQICLLKDANIHSRPQNKFIIEHAKKDSL